MRQHAIMQTDTAWEEPVGLRVIAAVDQAHELRHDVQVIPRRPEGFLRHHPALWENHEVDVRGSLLSRRGCHDREDGWIRVVKQNRSHG